MLALIAMLELSTALSHSEPSPKVRFHETGVLSLGGEGGWDYLTIDAANRRLYIARSDRVIVVELDSGKLSGEVKGFEGAHGIALAREFGRGFASSGKTGEVIAFDMKTLAVLGRVKTGEDPDAVLYDPSSKTAFVFNGKSHSVSLIDPQSLTVVSTLLLPGKPEFAVSDRAGHVFVNIEDKSEIVVLDSYPKSPKIGSSYPLSPCEKPTGLSIDRASHRLIVGCGNELTVIVDSDTGKVLQHFPVGRGVDATAFDRAHAFAFVSAGDGSLTVLAFEKSGFRLLERVSTRKGARTLAVDEATGRVYLPFAKSKAQPVELTQEHARPSVLPGTFAVLVLAP